MSPPFTFSVYACFMKSSTLCYVKHQRYSFYGCNVTGCLLCQDFFVHLILCQQCVFPSGAAGLSWQVLWVTGATRIRGRHSVLTRLSFGWRSPLSSPGCDAAAFHLVNWHSGSGFQAVTLSDSSPRQVPCRFCPSRCWWTAPGASATTAVMEAKSGGHTSGSWSTAASLPRKPTGPTREWWVLLAQFDKIQLFAHKE